MEGNAQPQETIDLTPKPLLGHFMDSDDTESRRMSCPIPITMGNYGLSPMSFRTLSLSGDEILAVADSEVSVVDALSFFKRSAGNNLSQQQQKFIPPTIVGLGPPIPIEKPQEPEPQPVKLSSDDGDSKGMWGIGGTTKALMPVHKDSDVYNMKHPKRGKALILNHENFNPNLDLGRRYGTERDKINLQKTLKELGFSVNVFDDLTYHEVAHEVEKLTKEDHTNNDCLLIAVLSHGDTQLMYAKDYSYKPDLLWNSFTADKCPSLAGKPKIFLIQACQGSQLDEGTKLVRVSRTEVDSNPQSYRIPNHADFLICFSTVPGFYSWRNTTNGSWFIQAICLVFANYATKKDLLSMMTIVARQVALYFESNTPSLPHMHQMKQIPFITSTLIRDVYLTSKK